VDNLIRSENVGRGNTGASSANVEGFGELNEIYARGINATHKNRDLETNPRGAAMPRILHALTFLIGELRPHRNPLGTPDLVRVSAYRMPDIRAFYIY
jgi:hypothetical protein